jgi:hypothetical protein
MQTLEPLRVPWYLSPLPPAANGSGPILRRLGERMHDVGSIPLVPHMLLSSRRHFREGATEGSKPSRAYAGLSGEWGGRRGDIPCPDNQLSTPNHRLEGPAHIENTPPREVWCRVDPETRVRTGQGDQVVARQGNWVVASGTPFVAVTSGRKPKRRYICQMPRLIHEAHKRGGLERERDQA